MSKKVKKTTRITIKLTPVELHILSMQLESNIDLLVKGIAIEEKESGNLLTEEHRMVSSLKTILIKVKSKLVGVASHG